MLGGPFGVVNRAEFDISIEKKDLEVVDVNGQKFEVTIEKRVGTIGNHGNAAILDVWCENHYVYTSSDDRTAKVLYCDFRGEETRVSGVIEGSEVQPAAVATSKNLKVTSWASRHVRSEADI